MVNEKMTSIADNIRNLLGISGKMGLDAMASNLGVEQTNIQNAFAAVGNKGGNVPSSKVSGNLPSAINSILVGVELNFEVVGGTTQPSSPTENTIWVNTSTAITSWIFSATQPTSPVAGMVWFSTGTSSESEFNALKKNGIQVYPESAKQYVSGAWKDVPVSIYQGSSWTQLENGLIYEAGKFASGFDAAYTACYDSSLGTVTKNSDSLQFRANGEDVHLFYITPAISVANFKTLYVTVESKSGTMYESAGKIGLVSSPSQGAAENEKFAAYTSFNSAKTYSVDVSGITGTSKYYIALRFETDHTTYTVCVCQLETA